MSADPFDKLDVSSEVRGALGKVVTILCLEERSRRGLDDPDEYLEQIDDILRVATERLLSHVQDLHGIAAPASEDREGGQRSEPAESCLPERPIPEQGGLPVHDRRWFGFPLEVRYASVVANRAGLNVAIESGVVENHGDIDRRVWIARIHGAEPDAGKRDIFITWTGTEEQFRSSGYFSNVGPFPRKRRWSYPDNLRGYLWRTGPDEFSFVIEFLSYISPQLIRKRSMRALAEPDYRQFREKLLNEPGNGEAA